MLKVFSVSLGSTLLTLSMCGVLLAASQRDYDQCVKVTDIAACTRVIEDRRQDRGVRADAYLHRADAHVLRKDYDRAIADYSESIRLAPSGKAFNGRGLVYVIKHAYERAIEDHTQAIRLEPPGSRFLDDYYNDRGLAYWARAGWRGTEEDYDRAIADYDAAITLGPGNPEYHSYRGLAYDRKKDYDRAIADHSEAIRLNKVGTQYRHYNDRGNAY